MMDSQEEEKRIYATKQEVLVHRKKTQANRRLTT